MKTIMKFKCLETILLIAIFGLGGFINAVAQDLVSADLITPIHGKLMLVGDGKISQRTEATFAFLAGEEKGKLVILTQSGRSKIKTCPKWQHLIGDIGELQLDKANKTLSGKELEVLRSATAVWLEEDFSKYPTAMQLKEELHSLLRKDGLVGGKGAAAESLAALIMEGNKTRDGFNLLPNSIVSARKGGQKQFIETLKSLPGRVGWEIPPSSSVVLCDGRKISVIDFPEITIRTAANGDWPERIETYGPPIEDLAYTADLISWNRSAIKRLDDVFPPLVAPVPEVPHGALVIIGGHGYPDGMWEKVIEFAGGKDANYVCISQSPSSTGAKMLRSFDCKNVAVHIVKTGVNGIGQADDPQFLEDLKNADAIYFGGGRTYKFMDAYLGTEAHLLMNKVLERGGIILGGSAGAQIQGDFLIRGDPRTNNTLWMEGNDMGLGFIKGVIIDAHFRERGRENILPSLLVQYPQMLGIGIDETTAIWVQGNTAEVLGPHSVSFYDLKNTQKENAASSPMNKPVVLMAGEKYDLKLRKPIHL